MTTGTVSMDWSDRETRNQQATVWIGGLEAQATEELVWELMVQSGPVVSVNMPRDKITGTHQGYAFCEFLTPEDADYAVRIMNSIRVYGKQIRVNKAAVDKKEDEGFYANLFVGNLDPDVDEKILYDTFSQFGCVLSAKVMTDDNSQSRGFGFVNFDCFESSDSAIAAMNGQYLCNRPIHVSYAYKKDGTKGERHGSAAERLLAKQSQVQNLRPRPTPMFSAAMFAQPNRSHIGSRPPTTQRSGLSNGPPKLPTGPPRTHSKRMPVMPSRPPQPPRPPPPPGGRGPIGRGMPVPPMPPMGRGMAGRNIGNNPPRFPPPPIAQRAQLPHPSSRSLPPLPPQTTQPSRPPQPPHPPQRSQTSKQSAQSNLTMPGPGGMMLRPPFSLPSNGMSRGAPPGMSLPPMPLPGGMLPPLPFPLPPLPNSLATTPGQNTSLSRPNLPFPMPPRMPMLGGMPGHSGTMSMMPPPMPNAGPPKRN